jgi:carbonic anhydrase/acetyltransferase-like protein (isoleucine patch superfamily)
MALNAAETPSRLTDGGDAEERHMRATDDPAAPARVQLPRLRGYTDLFWRSVHFRFGVANALCGLLPDFVSGAVRGRMYRWAGFAIGDGAFIMGNLALPTASPGFYDKLVVGADVTIADHVTINLDAKVTIGKNVAIAPHVLIYTGSHKISVGSRRIGEFVGLPVTIEEGAWVRLGAVIVPGVTIGRGSVVAAGAVVLKDVPPNTYVEGNPAKVIRKLGWGDR